MVYRLSVVTAVACAAVALSCSSTRDASFVDPAPDRGLQTGDVSGFGTDDADAGIANHDAGTETCDGVDNDGNGVIDDLDVAGDGICDCLRIANIGAAGRVGRGDVFADWINGKSTAGAAFLGNAMLTKPLLDTYQVIVAGDLSQSRKFAQAEIDALAEWLRAGGGLLTLIGYADPSERANVNALLAPHGLGYGAQPILHGGGTTLPVRGWVAHPVTEGITNIGIDNGYAVEGSGTTIATEQGYVVLKGREVGAGHLLVWGDEWITYDSEWKNHPDYQVPRFWVNMIRWLSPEKKCQVPVPATVK
jgi:hypothetical protein